MKIEETITRLGLELPTPPKPVGSYLPVKSSGNIVFTSGQTARINGIRRFVGKIGTEVTIDDGYLSARDACLNCLSALKEYVGDLDRIVSVIKVVGYVNSSPGFNQQPAIIDGASELLMKLFGDDGAHARSAVGVSELPFNASVELEMIVEIT